VTAKRCPECSGSGKNTERIDKYERADLAEPGGLTWESRCACCRGRGYILYGEMYPTAIQFNGAYRTWMDTEVIPETQAHLKRMESPTFRKELAESIGRHITRTISQRKALLARMDKALKIAVAKVERMA